MPDFIQPLPPHPAGRLWLVSLLDEPAPSAWQACSADEHTRAARFKFEVHARRYRAAHAALRQVLSDALDVRPEAVDWRLGAHGKPHLSGTLAGWHVNLSHSEDWALIGLGDVSPIGVDIECCKPLTDLAMLAERNYTGAEQTTLSLAATEEQAALFYQLWSRKEACLKALGSGLAIEPQCFEAGVAAPTGSATLVSIPIAGSLTCPVQLWSLQLPMHVDAQAAVARLSSRGTPTGW
jgi:4'-phosphopantetheinyl transferase